MNTDEGSESRAVAVRAFKWILSAYKPLGLSELSYAAALRDDGDLDPEVNNDFVLDVCSNFVTIDTSEQAQFVHASVREFLEDLETDDSKVYSERSVHTQAAKTCLVYLTSSMFLSAPEIDLYTGFPEYVRRFWPFHCKSCEDNRKKDNVLRKSLLGFMALKEVHPGFRRWHKCIQGTKAAVLRDHRPVEQTRYSGRYLYRLRRRELQDCLSPKPNPFLVACVFGFLDVVEKHPTKDQAMLSAQNIWSRCGLFLACKYGHVDIALMLLKKGASVDTRDKKHETPLHTAVLKGNEALVRMLLEAGADVDSEDDSARNPLYMAVYIGSIPLVRVLLNFHANPNKARKGRTCLEQAVYKGHEDIAQLLWEAGGRIRPDAPQGLTSSLTRQYSAPALFSLAKQDGRTENYHEYQHKDSWKTQRRLNPRRASDDIFSYYHTPIILDPGRALDDIFIYYLTPVVTHE